MDEETERAVRRACARFAETHPEWEWIFPGMLVRGFDREAEDFADVVAYDEDGTTLGIAIGGKDADQPVQWSTSEYENYALLVHHLSSV